MKYNIELRNSNSELYKDNEGFYITSNQFAFIGDDNDNDERIETNCYKLAENFKAVTKPGTKVTVEVCVFNTISSTWMQVYSLYYEQKRFIKH